MRPREACANWLICAALNEASGASLMFASDPTGGDGVIFDSETAYEVALTEHVIAVPSDDANVVARQLPNPLFFADVYVVSGEGSEAGEYVYRVAFSMSPRATPQSGAYASRRASLLGEYAASIAETAANRGIGVGR
jgi:hypothetical protein